MTDHVKAIKLACFMNDTSHLSTHVRILCIIAVNIARMFLQTVQIHLCG